MKKHKRIIIIAIFIILGICIIKYISNQEGQIKKFVIKNNVELEVIAEAYLKGDTTVKTYKGVEIERVWSGDNDIVQFYYGGIGIAPSSKYFGFYYSPNDVPVAYQNSEFKLSLISENEWEWAQKGTDNGGRTIKIMKNWFYYEAWF